MCLAIPGKILSRQGDVARIDFGGSVIREANIAMVDCDVGDYVIVHAGFAIQKLSVDDAEETLRLFQELVDLEKGDP